MHAIIVPAQNTNVSWCATYELTAVARIRIVRIAAARAPIALIELRPRLPPAGAFKAPRPQALDESRPLTNVNHLNPAACFFSNSTRGGDTSPYSVMK